MHILLVSKPLCPPWHDSGKNWARDVATYTGDDEVVHHVLVPSGRSDWSEVPGVVAEAVYSGDGRFAPRIMDNARALRRLVRRGVCDVVHFCFAPNPRTNHLARLAMQWRRQPSVHTVLSVPARFEDVRGVLFAERVVCVSRWTADKMREAGVAGVEVVPAAIPLEVPLGESDPQRAAEVARGLGLDPSRPTVVFPGDYEFSQAADVFAGAIERLWREVDAEFVFACRIKRRASIAREQALKARLSEPVWARRVHFLREVDDMRGLLACARAVVLPAESTYAKMDIPLVVLEAMAERTPVILADVAPLREALGDDPQAAGGALVEALSPRSLAEALRPLLNDPDEARQRGLLARTHIERHHDAAVVCPRYTAIYRDLL